MFVLCSLLAILGFLAGFVFAPGGTSGALSERLLSGAMVGATTFIAALILGFRDRKAFGSTRGSVRRWLLAQTDLSDEDFYANLSGVSPQIALEVRDCLGNFFDVSPSKIVPVNDLSRDLQFDKFEPWLHTFVVESLLAARGSTKERYSFRSFKNESLQEFIREVEAVVDGRPNQ